MRRGCFCLAVIFGVLAGPAVGRPDEGAGEDEDFPLLIEVNVLSDKHPDEFTVAVGDVVEFYAFGEVKADDAFDHLRPVATAFRIMGGMGGGFMSAPGGKGGGMFGQDAKGGMGGGAPNPTIGVDKSRPLAILLTGDEGTLEKLAMVRRGVLSFGGIERTSGTMLVQDLKPQQGLPIPLGPILIFKASKAGKAKVEATISIGGSTKVVQTYEITVTEKGEGKKGEPEGEAVPKDGPEEPPK